MSLDFAEMTSEELLLMRVLHGSESFADSADSANCSNSGKIDEELDRRSLTCNVRPNTSRRTCLEEFQSRPRDQIVA